MDWTVPAEQLRVAPPKDRGLGIAILGCGEIANIGHLPAYRSAGLQVVACFDTNQQAASATADRFDIPNVCGSLDELLCLPEVKIVDIAFHMAGRIPTVKSAAERGKHILIQKPIAHSLSGGRDMVSAADTAGVLFQANQQARWAPVFMLVKKWLEMGAIGRLNFMLHEMRGWQDDSEKWYVRQENMTLVDHGIHYFDILRYFAGRDARRVAAMHASVPGQKHMSPVIYSAVIDFGDNLTACHCFNNKVETKDPWGLHITLDGDDGTIFCDFETAKLVRKDGEVVEVKPDGKWFPDAFAGPMVDLMDSIVDGREPMCSGQRNLGTLRLVLGALQSAHEGKFVNI